MRRWAQAIDSRTHAPERTAGAHDAHPRLLGGFAGGFSPKGCVAPAFPQVSEVGATQRLPKTDQKSGTMAKSAPISCKTAQKSRGCGRGWRARTASRSSSRGRQRATGASGGPKLFPASHLRTTLRHATVLKHPRVARPASWQIGLAPIGVADAAAVHRIFPYNLISDALRMAAHASLLPICAFPIAS